VAVNARRPFSDAPRPTRKTRTHNPQAKGNLVMKKTIFSVLAFVLVLTTVLTGIAVTSVSAESNLNMGDCYRVSEDTPIIVDGKMDEAYKYGFSVMMTDRVQNVEGVYTYGIA
jgi:hypothetical protein